jgi:UDP-N-acetylmuramyl pentapeptide phosphotransferase/UDP-N-acetylglucosamine-1-phosphate transferase
VFIFVALAFCYLLLDQLKANTQYCVWGLVLGLFFLVGGLGIYFAAEARDAFRHA